MSAAITEMMFAFSALVKFNNTDLGALAKDIKVRLKFKETKFGNTQSDFGISKIIKFATDVEVEFDSDNATIANLQKALGGIGTLAAPTLTIAANTKFKPVPYTLYVEVHNKNAGIGYDLLKITITNMVATSEALELLFQRDKNLKVPMKFVSTSGWSATITEYTPA